MRQQKAHLHLSFNIPIFLVSLVGFSFFIFLFFRFGNSNEIELRR